VPETEPAGGQSFLIGGRDGARGIAIGRIHIRSEGGDQGVEDVSRKGDQRRQRRVRRREGDLEAQDGRGIGSWTRTTPLANFVQPFPTGRSTQAATFPYEYHPRPEGWVAWGKGHEHPMGTCMLQTRATER
jgi:hypothetical protein